MPIECHGDDHPLIFHDTLFFSLLILSVHVSKFNVYDTMTLPLKLALVLVLLHNISAAQYHNIWKKTFPFLKEIEKNKYFHFFKKSKKPVLPIAAYHLPHRRAGGWDRRRPPGQPPCAQRQGSNDEHVRRMASDGVERTAGGREAHPAIFPTCVLVRPGSVSSTLTRTDGARPLAARPKARCAVHMHNLFNLNNKTWHYRA